MSYQRRMHLHWCRYVLNASRRGDTKILGWGEWIQQSHSPR